MTIWRAVLILLAVESATGYPRSGHVRLRRDDDAEEKLLKKFREGQEQPKATTTAPKSMEELRKFFEKSGSKGNEEVGGKGVPLNELLQKLKKGGGVGGATDNGNEGKGNLENLNQVMGGGGGGERHRGGPNTPLSVKDGEKLTLGELLRKMGVKNEGQGYENRDVSKILTRLDRRAKKKCNSQGECRSSITLCQIMAELRKEDKGEAGDDTEDVGDEKPILKLGQANIKGRETLLVDLDFEAVANKLKTTMDKVNSVVQKMSQQGEGNPLVGLMGMVQNFFGGEGSEQKADGAGGAGSNTKKKKKNKSEEED